LRFNDFGSFTPLRPTTAPALSAPASSGGSTDSNEIARRGSPPTLSSHRPIQPVVLGCTGLALCQMSIERKWLRSGFG
jgi:hypothetical protein